MPSDDDQALRSRLGVSSEMAIKAKLESYRWRLYEEADRLSTERDDGTGLEPITPGDIQAAAKIVGAGHRTHDDRLSGAEVACQVVSYVAAIVAGFFVNNITKPWGAIGFVAVDCLGLATFTVSLSERRKGRT